MAATIGTVALPSLHKRGYRESGHPAPLKETLAAAIGKAAEGMARVLVDWLGAHGVEPIGGDSSAAVVEELRALPGQVNFAVARLDESGPTLVASHNPDEAMELADFAQGLRLLVAAVEEIDAA